MRGEARRVASVAVGALVAAAAAHGQTSIETPAPITDARLLEPEPGDWLHYRRTYDVTAFSPLRRAYCSMRGPASPATNQDRSRKQQQAGPSGAD